MTFCTHAAMTQPGLAIAEMCYGGMTFTEDGEYIDTGFESGDIPAEETEPGLEREEHNAPPKPPEKVFRDPAEELAALITEQTDDMVETRPCTTCTKGSHQEFGTTKDWMRSLRRGKDKYKNGRVRPDGSGRVWAQNITA